MLQPNTLRLKMQKTFVQSEKKLNSACGVPFNFSREFSRKVWLICFIHIFTNTCYAKIVVITKNGPWCCKNVHFTNKIIHFFTFLSSHGVETHPSEKAFQNNCSRERLLYRDIWPKAPDFLAILIAISILIYTCFIEFDRMWNAPTMPTFHDSLFVLQTPFHYLAHHELFTKWKWQVIGKALFCQNNIAME